MDWKYDYLVEQIHRTAYKKHESFVVGALLHDPELRCLQPCTQFYVRCVDKTYALLDLFYPQINLAIEIDEEHHENNPQKDLLRQKNIEKKLNCQFERIVIKDQNVFKQLYELKQKIKKLLKENQDKRELKLWEKPQKMEIGEAKNKFNQTLFVKIKGEIPPDTLLARQTGE